MIIRKKGPGETRPFHVVWCSLDGRNDGGARDTGELQGATISTSVWTVPDGITKQSDNTSAVEIKGVTYGAGTVATIWLTGGTNLESYALRNTITTSDGRTLTADFTILIGYE